MSRFVDDRLTVIILANCDGWNPIGISRVVAGLSEPALVMPSKMPEASNVASDADGPRSPQLRHVLDELAAGTKDDEWMTVGLCGTMDSRGDTELADLLKGSAAKANTMLTFLGEDDVSGRKIALDGLPVARMSYWKLTGAEPARYFTYYLTAEGKVAQVQWTRE